MIFFSIFNFDQDFKLNFATKAKNERKDDEEIEFVSENMSMIFTSFLFLRMSKVILTFVLTNIVRCNLNKISILISLTRFQFYCSLWCVELKVIIIS